MQLAARFAAVVCLSLGAAHALDAAAGGADDDDTPKYDPPLYMHRHEVKNAKARGALCSDGTPAVFYYRGCNETYYQGDAGGCVNITQTWVISFEAGGEYCFDAASCAARSKARPALVTAPNASKLVINGLLQPFPEVNPNFYKAHAVHVPYCSSDMWAGSGGGGGGGRGGSGKLAGFGFNGRAIIKAVLEDLLTIAPSGHDDDGEPHGPAWRYNLVAAEELLLVGGPGVASQAAAIAALLPGNLSAAASLVCDGCVLLDQPPLVPSSARGSPATTPYSAARTAPPYPNGSETPA